MKYVKQFDEHDDYTLYVEDDPILPNISKCDAERHVHYNPVKFKYIPLTFKVLSNGVIKFTASNEEYTRTLQYNKNNTEWVSITSSLNGTEISVEPGDEVAFKGDNTNGLSYWNGLSGNENLEYFNTFRNTTCIFHLYGNIMSLINSQDYVNATLSDTVEQFAQLFCQVKGLRSAKNLILPNITQPYLYYSTFERSGITEAPYLPATTLAIGSYCQMFLVCNQLHSVQPILQAETVPKNGYNNMFAETAITKGPEIMATSVGDNGFWNMFEGCEKMTQGPSILRPTDLSGTTQCYRGMFKECYNLQTAPQLPATKVGKQSYLYMFQNCRSLVNPPVLPATVLGEGCYSGMFNNCWTLASAPTLPATELGTQCYYRMFLNCRALTTAPALPATTLTTSCYGLMFNGCTSLTASPILPAPTLVATCYQQMFQGCTSLNEITCWASDFSATNCLQNWVSNVSGTGTFIKDSTVTNWPTGNSGIPNNWTVQDAS